MTAEIALTKFRTPRLRGDTVARATLLAKLQRSVETRPLTIVRAPGGSGKTVLLTQLAAGLVPGGHALWIALDSDDNDVNRFFAALCRAVQPLGLTWDVDPRALAATAGASRAQLRAALAAFVNALCTAAAARIVIVLDDLHRLDQPEIFALIEALVERLPEHVALVIGTRVEPPLALARWRAHGEVGEFGPADLRFSDNDALELAARKGAGAPDPAAVQAAIRRTDGWAVGLSMLLQSSAQPPRIEAADRAAGHPHLFEYLAQEVLAELPPAMRDFLLRVSILDELEPGLCGAVTGRSDSAELLRDLFRRNLFVTVIDESVPVLRFHDLFRDFLQAELRRSHAQELIELHRRAGEAESNAARAVAHFLEAQLWDRALQLIGTHADRLLAEGAVRLLERWLEQIPAAVRAANPIVAYLNGACGWLAWDWTRARRELPLAVAGLSSPADGPRRVRALFQLVDALNSAGDLAGARARLDEVARQPLDDLGHAQLALQRAWCLAAERDTGGVAASMHEFVDYAARDPERICPLTAGLIHCMLVGKPGVAESFERFVALAEQVREPVGRPWHLPLYAVEGWARVWRGDRAGAAAALGRAAEVFKQFRGIRLMGERIRQFQTLFGALAGGHSASDEMARDLIAGLQSPELAAHRAVWERAYRHAHARMHWIHDQHDAWLRCLAPLATPRSAVEWPFIDVAAAVVRGQRSIVAEDWATARTELEAASADYVAFCLPMIYSDPRVSLAYALLRGGSAVAAWRVFEPVVGAAIATRDVGPLLLDSRGNVAALLDAAPAKERSRAGWRELRALLEDWSGGSDAADAPAADAGPLSEREREVLALVASGASNKHIARQLDLSLHTVKRHICNILDKLDCDSRGQAADWYRRSAS